MQNLEVKIAGMKPFVASSVELKVDQPLLESPISGFGSKVVVPGPKTVTLYIKSAIPMDVIKSMSAWRDSSMAVSKSYKRQIEIELGNGKKWIIYGAFITEMQSHFMAMQETGIDLTIVADSYAEDTSNKDTPHPESFIGHFKDISDVSVCLKKNGRVLLKGMTIYVKTDGHFYTYGDFGWEKRASGFNVAKIKKDEMKSLEQLAAEEQGKKEKAEAAALKKALAKKKAEKQKKIVHPPDPKHNPVVQTFVDLAKGGSQTGMQIIDAAQKKVKESVLIDPALLGGKPKPDAMTGALPPPPMTNPGVYTKDINVADYAPKIVGATELTIRNTIKKIVRSDRLIDGTELARLTFSPLATHVVVANEVGPTMAQQLKNGILEIVAHTNGVPVAEPPPPKPTKDEIFPRKRVIRRKKA